MDSPGAGPSTLVDFDYCDDGYLFMPQPAKSRTTTPILEVDTDPSLPTNAVYCECKLDHSNGRNLVVCIDGTANQFSFQVRSKRISRALH